MLEAGGGLGADDQVWDRLVVSAAQMLSGLLGAWTAYYHQDGARLLVDIIDALIVPCAQPRTETSSTL